MGADERKKDATESGSHRELLEVGIVVILVMACLAAVATIGVWYSVVSCYSAHPGEPVRWNFPHGCQVNIAGTMVTVPST